MSDYTDIITFRKKLRHNCRLQALQVILRNNPLLYPDIAPLLLKHEWTVFEQEEIPEDLERLVRDVLNASGSSPDTDPKVMSDGSRGIRDQPVRRAV
jgi:hypothetical protein